MNSVGEVNSHLDYIQFLQILQLLSSTIKFNILIMILYQLSFAYTTCLELKKVFKMEWQVFYQIY